MITFETAEDYVDRTIFRPGTRFTLTQEYSGMEARLTYRCAAFDTSYPPNYTRRDIEMTESADIDLDRFETLDQLGRAMLVLVWKYDRRMWLHEASEAFRQRAATVNVSGNNVVDDGDIVSVRVNRTALWFAPFHAHHGGYDDEDGLGRWSAAEPEMGDELSKHNINGTS